MRIPRSSHDYKKFNEGETSILVSQLLTTDDVVGAFAFSISVDIPGHSTGMMIIYDAREKEWLIPSCRKKYFPTTFFEWMNDTYNKVLEKFCEKEKKKIIKQWKATQKLYRELKNDPIVRQYEGLEK